MTAAFQLLTADEEDAELEGVLGFALTPATTDAQLDSYASRICRRLGEIAADRKRYEDAKAEEVAYIERHYEARLEKLSAEQSQLEGMGQEIAKRASFPGKSKSRSVAFGSYGSRKVGEKVEVVDEVKAMAWLRKYRHLAAIRTKTEEAIDKTAAKAIVLSVLHVSGEVPDGFTHEAETEKFYVKAD